MPKMNTQLRKVLLTMDTTRMYRPSLGLAMLRWAAMYTWARPSKKKEKATIRAYSAARAMTPASLPKRPMNWTGKKHIIQPKIRFTAPET